MNSAEIGKKGEALTAKYYMQHGARLLAHNYRTRYGELDLVLDDAGVIVICEVKTRSSDKIASPAEAVNLHKQRCLLMAARLFIQQTGREDCTIRFDVAEVLRLPEDKWQLHIIRDAFTE